MIPNYKRPSIREYFNEVWETGPTDQDIDMLLYLEECERRSKMLDIILEEPWFTEECPLSCAPEGEIENRIIHICGCYADSQKCDGYKECWLEYFERKMKDERNAR